MKKCDGHDVIFPIVSQERNTLGTSPKNIGAYAGHWQLDLPAVDPDLRPRTAAARVISGDRSPSVTARLIFRVHGTEGLSRASLSSFCLTLPVTQRQGRVPPHLDSRRLPYGFTRDAGLQERSTLGRNSLQHHERAILP